MRAITLSLSIVAGVLTALPAGTARADGYYCGWIIPAGSWCSAGYRQGVYRNRAKYPGSGTVRVGISVYHHIAQNWWYTAYANNFVAREWFCPLSGSPHVGNASGHRHTVEGHFRNTHAVCASLPDPGNQLDAVRAEIADMVDTTHGSLAVLRDDRGVELSATTQNAAQSAIDSGFLVDASAARLARVGERGEEYIVVPGTSTCLFRQADDGTDVTCSSPEQIARGESVVVSERTADLPDGHVRIAGLAPDGVTAAQIRLSEGGPLLAIPVVNNVFVTETAGEAAQVPVVVTYSWSGDTAGDDEADDDPELDATETEDVAAGCAAGGTGGGITGGLLLALGLLLARRRRR